MTVAWYKNREERICTRKLLRPTVQVEIVCNISYTSPKKKNHYAERWTVGFDTIFAKIKTQKEVELSVAYQRLLMTDSLRYDILKRDNYRCRICGKSSNDGVLLEVDHITPVSKGGKTVEHNLQTLCRQCNQGKSAKM
ncbi:HNH endonuclease [Methanolapillus ohkumae]